MLALVVACGRLDRFLRLHGLLLGEPARRLPRILQTSSFPSPLLSLSCHIYVNLCVSDPSPYFARRIPQRWTPQPTSNIAPNRGPWDDVKDAWGRGGYIESAVPRECDSHLPKEVLWYMNHLELDRLGKESFETAMRLNPKRWVNGRVKGVSCFECRGRRGGGFGQIPPGFQAEPKPPPPPPLSRNTT